MSGFGHVATAKKENDNNTT